MKYSRETVLEEALDAFWAKIAEVHPEHKPRNLPPTEAYDLEMWAGKAYDTWLEVNKPVYYVQRTATLVVRITGAGSPEEAESLAADLPDPAWFNNSLDTTNDYIVLDASGKAY